MCTLLGVYISLGGRFYRNNSVIPITDVIGDGNLAAPDRALQCVTDRKPCCYSHSNRHGEWYFQMANRYQTMAICRKIKSTIFQKWIEVKVEQFISTILGTVLCLQLENFAAKYPTLLELIKICAILSKAPK